MFRDHRHRHNQLVLDELQRHQTIAVQHERLDTCRYHTNRVFVDYNPELNSFADLEFEWFEAALADRAETRPDVNREPHVARLPPRKREFSARTAMLRA